MWHREIPLAVLIVLVGSVVFAQDEHEPATFPLSPPTLEQVEEARTCHFDVNVLPSNLNDYEPETACEWATVALKNLEAAQTTINFPEQARLAYQQAVVRNPAIALARPIYDGFFLRLDSVIDLPVSLKAALSSISLSYHYAGEGDLVNYAVTIKQVERAFVASGNGLVVSAPHEGGDSTKAALAWENVTIPDEVLLSFNNSLYNLVPTANPIEAPICHNFIVQWQASVTYADGTELLLSTYGSQISPAGGPWQVLINDQYYVQVDLSLFWMIRNITEELQLPEGFPMYLDCDEDYDLLSFAYPESHESKRD